MLWRRCRRHNQRVNTNGPRHFSGVLKSESFQAGCDIIIGKFAFCNLDVGTRSAESTIYPGGGGSILLILEGEISGCESVLEKGSGICRIPPVWMVGGGIMSEISLVVNGRSVRGSVEDRTLLVHFLREASEPDRYACRMRHVSMRHLCRPCRRQGSKVVHIACRAGVGIDRGDDRRACEWCRAASRSGSLQRASWPSMRLLHAWHDHGCHRHDPALSGGIGRSRLSAPNSKAISAAAPVTITS